MFINHSEIIAYSVDNKDYCWDCLPKLGTNLELTPITKDDMDGDGVLVCDICHKQIANKE